jgi:hypothetical protein
LTLLATICNPTPNAKALTLWLGGGDDEHWLDLSDAVNQPGDAGLTGIARHGEHIFVAVQSGATPRILVLDRTLALVETITSPEFADLHSLHVVGDTLVAVSTGQRCVLRIGLSDRNVAKPFQCTPRIHLNSVHLDEHELLLCCHYLRHLDPTARDGGIFSVYDGRVVLDGLEQLHSVIRVGDAYIVLDSERSEVLRFDRSGIRQRQTLEGFLRGCAVFGDTVLVAGSVRRVASRATGRTQQPLPPRTVMAERVVIHELDAATLQVRARHLPILPGFEIYGMLAVADADGIQPSVDRLVRAEHHAAAALFYAAAKRSDGEAGMRRQEAETRLRLLDEWSDHDGAIDGISQTAVAGWLVPKRSDITNALLVHVDGVFLCRIDPVIPRPQISAAAHVPLHRCGFRLEFPATVLDGGEHLLTIAPEQGHGPRADVSLRFTHDGLQSVADKIGRTLFAK